MEEVAEYIITNHTMTIQYVNTHDRCLHIMLQRYTQERSKKVGVDGVIHEVGQELANRTSGKEGHFK